jgi:hypothetical protein|tara:strand:+ start:2753 stop:3124 length:372 start_codon:yes stop_codon:yes gene_type:complete
MICRMPHGAITLMTGYRRAMPQIVLSTISGATRFPLNYGTANRSQIMNKDRRKALYDIYERLDHVLSELRDVVSDEQDAFDNMPESLQGSEKGEAIEENVQDLESAVDDVDSVISVVSEVMDR